MSAEIYMATVINLNQILPSLTMEQSPNKAQHLKYLKLETNTRGCIRGDSTVLVCSRRNWMTSQIFSTSNFYVPTEKARSQTGQANKILKIDTGFQVLML